MATVSTHSLTTQLQLSLQLLEHVWRNTGELGTAELEVGGISQETFHDLLLEKKTNLKAT